MVVGDVATLPLSPELRQALVDGGFTTLQELAQMGPVALAEETGMNQDDALYVLTVAEKFLGGQAAGGAAPAMVAATELYQATPQVLQTFCEPIDRILRGGLPVGVVTEVCGAPGAGKTQLAMQLSAIVQLPVSRGGLGGNAVYLDSEGSFTPERLSEIAGAHLERLRSAGGAGLPERLNVEGILDGVFYFRIHNGLQQLNTIETMKDFIVKNPKVKLVVIDSLVFHLRQDQQDATLRRQMVITMYQMLTSIARKQKVAVVVVNHLTTRISKDSAKLVPVSNDAWGHVPTLRLALMAGERGNWLQIQKSPCHAQQAVPFRITQGGIEAVQSTTQRPTLT